jgi:hypothetical protein
VRAEAVAAVLLRSLAGDPGSLRSHRKDYNKYKLLGFSGRLYGESGGAWPPCGAYLSCVRLCGCMCVCVYVCFCMCVCVCVCKHVCMGVYLCVCLCVCVLVSVCICLCA